MPNMQLILLVILVVAAIAISEVVSLVYNHKHVTFRCEIDMNLTEPGEIVTLTYHIQNRSWFPVSFASFCFQFPDVVEVQERPEWLALHHVGGKSDRMYSFDVNLRPHHGIRGKLHFSIRERGLFELGKVYIETGDFLGFSSKVRSITLYDRIICTASSLPQDPAVQPMGGFLGDLSVRRFIMEDPSLILGYRDYTGAEPMKSISWIQTARTGRLTVKKHDFTVDTDVSVLVDLEQCQKQLAERCLSLVRTVCDVLEEQRIAYSVLSNGDLFQTAKGIGRMHTFEVQKRIGLSRFVRYQHFDDLLSQWARPGFSQRGCIVIAPKRTEELGPALVRLENATGANICLLIGEEVGRDAEL